MAQIFGTALNFHLLFSSSTVSVNVDVQYVCLQFMSMMSTVAAFKVRRKSGSLQFTNHSCRRLTVSTGLHEVCPSRQALQIIVTASEAKCEQQHRSESVYTVSAPRHSSSFCRELRFY